MGALAGNPEKFAVNPENVGGSLIVSDIFRDVYHRRNPDFLFVILDEMQELAVFTKSHVNIMPPSYPMEKEDQECVGLHGMTDQRDHLVGGIPVHREAVDVVKVDLTEGIENTAHAPGGDKIFLKPVVEQRVMDPPIAAGIGEGSFGLSVDGVQEDIGLADLGDGPFDAILTQVIVCGHPGSSRQTGIAGME